jgi:hypothetical protein
MHDDNLDNFPQEGEPTATRVIVISDDEITSSWDAFPSEETEEADSQAVNDALAMSTYTSPSRTRQPIRRAAARRRRSFASAALVVAFGVGLFAGQAIVKRFVSAPQLQREVAVLSPTATAIPASSESPKIGAPVLKDADVVRTPRPARPSRPIASPAPPERKARIATVASTTTSRVLRARPPVVEPPPISKPATATASAAPQPALSAAATPAPVVAAATSPATSTPARGPAAVATSGVVAAPAAAVAPPPAVAQATDTRAVLGTLHRYEEAFSTLDSEAAQHVWPDVNVKALDRAFDQLAQQSFDLRACDVGVTGERAEAMCTGTASYARKVGNKAMRVESRRWRFTLRRNSGEWLIERVDVR